MKKGDVFECRVCGLALKVLKVCDPKACGCGGKGDPGFLCCGAPLRKKRAPAKT
jgi:hypothetical protein